MVMPQDAPMNIGAWTSTPAEAADRVVGIQTKLHRWAAAEPGRRFDDLFNLVADPAFMLTAWARARSNAGARSAGIDGRVASQIDALPGGVEASWPICVSRCGPVPRPAPGSAGDDSEIGREATGPGHPDGGGILPPRPVTIRVSLLSLIRSIR